MKVTKKLAKIFMRFIVKSQYSKILERESELAALDNSIKPTKESPIRFEIPLEMVKLDSEKAKPAGLPKSLPHFVGSIKGVQKALKLSEKIDSGKDEIDDVFLQQFERYAKSIGISSIGYTEVPRDYIFNNCAILYPYAIVLSMEMDKVQLNNAPSKETGTMVFRTYNNLGNAVIKLSNYLKQNYYNAQPSHPLGGQALYPALAELAGIGFHGYHGLIITPEHGPRVRLAAIFTDIKNLPVNQTNTHKWIEDYCEKCKKCLRDCPSDAIHQPKKLSLNRIKCIETEKCFLYFAENEGCSVCLKVCPFNKVGYSKIYSNYEKSNN